MSNDNEKKAEVFDYNGSKFVRVFVNGGSWRQYAICISRDRYYGWLFGKHPDGQWVTVRRVNDDELQKAEESAQ